MMQVIAGIAADVVESPLNCFNLKIMEIYELVRREGTF